MDTDIYIKVLLRNGQSMSFPNSCKFEVSDGALKILIKDSDNLIAAYNWEDVFGVSYDRLPQEGVEKNNE